MEYSGHWTYPTSFYRKQLILDHLIATYKKPVVSSPNNIYIYIYIYIYFKN